MDAIGIAALVIGVALAALAAAALLWWVVRRLGRATGLDRKADRFLEVDGDGLSPSDAIRFREQHPHGGAP